MGHYSKLIGAIVGGVIGLGVTWGLIPEQYATPEFAAWLTTFFSGLATYLAPANTPAPGAAPLESET